MIHRLLMPDMKREHPHCGEVPFNHPTRIQPHTYGYAKHTQYPYVQDGASHVSCREGRVKYVRE
jgi:hypothetical protein